MGREREMKALSSPIENLARRYGLEIVYAFGSRAKEIQRLVQGKRRTLSRTKADKAQLTPPRAIRARRSLKPSR